MFYLILFNVNFIQIQLNQLAGPLCNGAICLEGRSSKWAKRSKQQQQNIRFDMQIRRITSLVGEETHHKIKFLFMASRQKEKRAKRERIAGKF